MGTQNRGSKQGLQVNWFNFLFSFHFVYGKLIVGSLIVMGIITAVICYLQFHLHIIEIRIPSNTLNTFGMVLGLLLVFRTNTAYERWLDGRKQYGSLMNASRNFALNIIHSAADFSRKQEILALHKSFIQATSEHLLQGQNDKKSLKTLSDSQKNLVEKASHKPMVIMYMLEEKLTRYAEDKLINTEQYFYAKRSLHEIVDAFGACERIKFTPVPLSYTLHLRRIVLIYCLVLPCTLVNDLGWWSIPVELIVFFAFLATELIGEEIEDPFSGDIHDLPIYDYSDNISRNIENMEVWDKESEK